MEPTNQATVARRLDAIIRELGKSRREMASFLDVGESRLGNWLASGPKGNMPAEAAMALLCSKVPALTMDYIYMGRLDGVPINLAVRLKARELGLEPDAQDLPRALVLDAVIASSRREGAT